MVRCFVFLFLWGINLAWASGPRVVVTIKPVHSLVAQVMKGVGTPKLLIKKDSPHGYSLTPSHMIALNKADLVVWVGPSLETCLHKVSEQPRFRKKSFPLETLKSIKILPYGTQEDHGDHTHGAIDPHLWLSPENAQEIVKAVAERLSTLDPAHAHFYEKNAAHALESLVALDAVLREILKPAKNQDSIVFHDAYGYFMHHFGLKAPYVLTQNPELPLSAQRIAEIQEIIKKHTITHAFSEPQFPQEKLFSQLGSQMNLGELDPLGYDVPSGPQAYGIIMRNLAHAFAGTSHS